MNFRLLSYYTQNTLYEEEIQKLRNDCKQLSVPLTITSTMSVGSWVENTMRKPYMILRAWDEIPTKAIVWVDADARIKKYPSYFDELYLDNIDFSVFQMGSQSRITSGTIYMKKSPHVKKFIERWWELCQIDKERLGDQHTLRKLIKNEGYAKYNIKYRPLPYEYCYIYDDSLRKLAPNINPILNEDVVVLHTQASRKVKKSEQ